ncbi:MAG: c-type cytochrome [Gemmatimonadaceae bacterium]
MSRWLRRIGYVLGTLVVLILMLSGFAFVKSSGMMTKKYELAVSPIVIVKDSTTLARGEHLATVIAKCTDCHTNDMAGRVFIDDPALGVVVAPNLTRGKGGVGDSLTDERMAFAIREGIKHDNTSALVMPSDDYRFFTDDDVAAVVAYVRSLPAVDRVLPKSQLHAVGRALSASGQLPIFMAEIVDHKRTHQKSIVADTSLAYGTYLGNVGGCTGCHGPGLSGGKIPGTPPEWPAAANLTPTGISKYTDAQIETILRTGKRPDGSSVNEVMPWKYTTHMTNDELIANIKFLRSVPPKAFGGR